MDLYNQMMDLINQLNISIKSLRKTGLEFAQADMDYKIALREELITLRTQGEPITNLQYIARGQKDVAKAKFNQIATEAVYKANLEAIQSLKLQIKILDNQLSREYGQG